MRDLVIFSLNNSRYGIWEDELWFCGQPRYISQLPLLPAHIAGLCSVEKGHTVTLADLSICLGLPAASNKDNGQALLVAKDRGLAGFCVYSELEKFSVAEEHCQPIPAYLQSEVIDQCLVFDQTLIPLINVKILFSRLSNKPYKPARINFSCTSVFPQFETDLNSVRLFACAEQDFACPAGLIDNSSPFFRHLTQLPTQPDYVAGLAEYQKTLLPVIHLARYLGLTEPNPPRTLLVAQIADVAFGFLVQQDYGLAKHEFVLQSLPTFLQSDYLRQALVLDEEIIPLLDLTALVNMAPTQDYASQLEAILDKASLTNVAQFSHTDISVVPFSLAGINLALPKEEVQEVLPIQHYQQPLKTYSFIHGLIYYQQELVPVLDISHFFGKSADVKDDWKLILIQNNDFYVFVLAEKVFEERYLNTDELQKLPFSLEYPVVYGCYSDGYSVDLILNVAAVIAHANNTEVKQFFDAYVQKLNRVAVHQDTAALIPEINQVEDTDNRLSVDFSATAIKTKDEFFLISPEFNQVATTPAVAESTETDLDATDFNADEIFDLNESELTIPVENFSDTDFLIETDFANNVISANQEELEDIITLDEQLPEEDSFLIGLIDEDNEEQADEILTITETTDTAVLENVEDFLAVSDTEINTEKTDESVTSEITNITATENFALPEQAKRDDNFLSKLQNEATAESVDFLDIDAANIVELETSKPKETGVGDDFLAIASEAIVSENADDFLSMFETPAENTDDIFDLDVDDIVESENITPVATDIDDDFLAILPEETVSESTEETIDTDFLATLQNADVDIGDFADSISEEKKADADLLELLEETEALPENFAGDLTDLEHLASAETENTDDFLAILEEEKPLTTDIDITDFHNSIPEKAENSFLAPLENENSSKLGDDLLNNESVVDIDAIENLVSEEPEFDVDDFLSTLADESVTELEIPVSDDEFLAMQDDSATDELINHVDLQVEPAATELDIENVADSIDLADLDQIIDSFKDTYNHSLAEIIAAEPHAILEESAETALSSELSTAVEQNIFELDDTNLSTQINAEEFFPVSELSDTEQLLTDALEENSVLNNIPVEEMSSIEELSIPPADLSNDTEVLVDLLGVETLDQSIELEDQTLASSDINLQKSFISVELAQEASLNNIGASITEELSANVSTDFIANEELQEPVIAVDTAQNLSEPDTLTLNQHSEIVAKEISDDDLLSQLFAAEEFQVDGIDVEESMADIAEQMFAKTQVSIALEPEHIPTDQQTDDIEEFNTDDFLASLAEAPEHNVTEMVPVVVNDSAPSSTFISNENNSSASNNGKVLFTQTEHTNTATANAKNKKAAFDGKSLPPNNAVFNKRNAYIGVTALVLAVAAVGYYNLDLEPADVETTNLQPVVKQNPTAVVNQEASVKPTQLQATQPLNETKPVTATAEKEPEVVAVVEKTPPVAATQVVTTSNDNVTTTEPAQVVETKVLSTQENTIVSTKTTPASTFAAPEQTAQPPETSTPTQEAVTPKSETEYVRMTAEIPDSSKTITLENKEFERCASISYTIKEQDTLWEIAEIFTETPYNYRLIAKQNRLRNINKLYVNTKIIIKNPYNIWCVKD